MRPAQATTEKVRQVRWQSGRGEWTDAARWTNGVPDGFSRASIHGESDVVVAKGRHVVGSLTMGTLSGDRVKLRIEGGELVIRRNYLHVGEASDSSGDVVLDGGALHCVADVYLSGANAAPRTACRGSLTIRAGSFVTRGLELGNVRGSEATLSIEGSRPSAVHVLDSFTLGAYGKGEGSLCTLVFTLDSAASHPSRSSPLAGA